MLCRREMMLIKQEQPMTHPLAATFRQLHQQGLLVLPNAWDAGSARIAHSAGAKAVATSSAAVAWAHGFADGHQLPSALLLATVQAITAAVAVPVSVDIEGGYADDPQAVAELAHAVMQAGAVGINIEDGTQAPALLVAKISAIRQRCGDALFINARTDVFIRNPVPADQRVAEVLRRGALYRQAGASGLFVPRIVLAQDIADVVTGAQLPVNVMATVGLPMAAQLQQLGVRRVSAGSSMAEALHAAYAAMAADFLQTAQMPALHAPALGYGRLNEIMAR
jgi:2-methylisocitrate lyase-like PEP mutase family enzyme